MDHHCAALALFTFRMGCLDRIDQLITHCIAIGMRDERHIMAKHLVHHRIDLVGRIIGIAAIIRLLPRWHDMKRLGQISRFSLR